MNTYGGDEGQAKKWPIMAKMQLRDYRGLPLGRDPVLYAYMVDSQLFGYFEM